MLEFEVEKSKAANFPSPSASTTLNHKVAVQNAINLQHGWWILQTIGDPIYVAEVRFTGLHRYST